MGGGGEHRTEKKLSCEVRGEGPVCQTPPVPLRGGDVCRNRTPVADMRTATFSPPVLQDQTSEK